MAHCLRARGFSAVTVLEKTGRIGGMSLKVEHEGEPHELGTAYLNPDYTEVFALLQAYDLDDRVPYEGRSVWLPDGKQLLFEDWVIGGSREALWGLPGRIRDILLDLIPDWTADLAINRYIRIHERLLGEGYSGFYPPSRPTRFLKRSAAASSAFFSATTLRS